MNSQSFHSHAGIYSSDPQLGFEGVTPDLIMAPRMVVSEKSKIVTIWKPKIALPTLSCHFQGLAMSGQKIYPLNQGFREQTHEAHAWYWHSFSWLRHWKSATPLSQPHHAWGRCFLHEATPDTDHWNERQPCILSPGTQFPGTSCILKLKQRPAVRPAYLFIRVYL